jgi:uncharacterized membrane protein HdeD (DUF308 family)
VDRVTRISSFTTDGGPRVVRTAWHTVQSQPSWIVRATTMAFLIIVGIPILLVVLLALFVSTVVFLVLAGCARLIGGVRRVLPADDGRENVRVIRRD